VVAGNPRRRTGIATALGEAGRPYLHRAHQHHRNAAIGLRPAGDDRRDRALVTDLVLGHAVAVDHLDATQVAQLPHASRRACHIDVLVNDIWAPSCSKADY